MPKLVAENQRRFAVDVVRKLRGERFEAYWAGGCVRDELLGLEPKDYDVATDATPDAIRRLFGHRRTLAIGAAFGVITLRGPRGAGQIEIATFRRDAAYSDGRHPDDVHFSTPREDASRRDFTINGLFYDPLGGQVIDFVGGRADIERKIVRAIGDPAVRFAEDKLRLLRAVRFAATFDFAIHAATLAAIRQMASQISVVSAERIATEMRRMLTDPRRAVAAELLLETGLAKAILPEVVPHDSTQRDRWNKSLAVLERLDRPGFPLALAALVSPCVDRDGAVAIGRRWRLSNDETDRVAWLVEHRGALEGASTRPWSAVQRILASDGADDLVALDDALASIGRRDPTDAAWCRIQRSRPPEELNPPPLVTGDDLVALGLSPGPRFAALLRQIRDAQLDGEIHTKSDGLALAEKLSESP